MSFQILQVFILNENLWSKMFPWKLNLVEISVLHNWLPWIMALCLYFRNIIGTKKYQTAFDRISKWVNEVSVKWWSDVGEKDSIDLGRHEPQRLRSGGPCCRFFIAPPVLHIRRETTKVKLLWSSKKTLSSWIYSERHMLW